MSKGVPKDFETALAELIEERKRCFISTAGADLARWARNWTLAEEALFREENDDPISRAVVATLKAEVLRLENQLAKSRRLLRRARAGVQRVLDMDWAFGNRPRGVLDALHDIMEKTSVRTGSPLRGKK